MAWRKLFAGGEPIPQALTLEVFHHDEGLTVGLVDLVNCADSWMSQRSRCLRLSFESGEGLGIGCLVGGKEFEGHFSLKFQVLSLVDHTHSTLA